jgi:hypothetical protein
VPISPTGPPQEPDVPPTTTGTPATVRVTGTVSDGVEPGCTLLTSDGVVYQLIWRHATPLIRPEMEVEGTLQPDLMTTCQQGTPLVVDRVVSP